MLEVPRRLLGAVLVVILLVQAMASPALAGGSVFKGLWLSIDTDGSLQALSVSSGAEPSVTYEDFFASVCADNGAASTHWVAAGGGSVDDSTLSVAFRKSGCGTFGKGGYQERYSHDATTDTLTDSYGNVWVRFP